MNNMSKQEIDERPLTTRPARLRAVLGRWWFWLLVALLAVAAYFVYDRAGTAQPAAPGKGRGGAIGADRPTPVISATARTGDINVYLNGLGTVTPLNTVIVKSRVDGQLMRILFTEGQVVKAGDLLAEIDPRPYQVQLTQAQGQMAKDQALLKNAQLDLERYKTLFTQDSIAKQQLDTQASLVRQYEGAIKADQGQVDSAKLQLVYSRVTAPVGGRLGLRQVDTGNVVHASDSNGIVVITQLQPVTVIFTITEDNVPRVMKRLQSGNKLVVDAYDREQKVKLATGTLTTIDNQIDSATGTVKVRAQFSNDDYSLFPNQFVNARLLLDVRQGATIVPTAAVQRGTQGTFVYVVKPDQTVTARTVKLGAAQGEDTAIESGVQTGEIVVVDGTDKLREGAQVAPQAKRDVPVAAPRATGAASGQQGTTEDRQKRWEALNKRIDAGEFGEEIKKLPEDARKARMRELREQRGAAADKAGQ